VILSEWRFDDPKHSLNDYCLHKELWTAFNKDEKQKRPFLFRSSRNENKLSVIVLSYCEPEEIEGQKHIMRKLSFTPVLEKGRYYNFVLRANVIKRLNNERCRVPLISQVSLIDWLKKKLGGAASISFVEVNEGERLHFKKDDKNKGEKCYVDIARTDYSGTIKCIDKNSLLSLVHNGIGPAKGFGCGLLLLRKLS